MWRPRSTTCSPNRTENLFGYDKNRTGGFGHDSVLVSHFKRESFKVRNRALVKTEEEESGISGAMQER